MVVMGRWFRFYDETLNNPKVQALEPVLFRAWVNFLCLASKHRGKIPPKAIAFALRVNAEEARRIIKALDDAGLVDGDDNFLFPHNWFERQFESDNSQSRVQRYRQRIEANGEKVHGYLKHRVTVTQRDNGRCIYCGTQKNLVMDHVVPVVQGGTGEIWNLALACKRHNSGKSGRDPFQAKLPFFSEEKRAFCRVAVDRVTKVSPRVTVTDTVTVTPPESETDTDTEVEGDSPSLRSSVSSLRSETSELRSGESCAEPEKKSVSTPDFVISMPTNRFETSKEEVGFSQADLDQWQTTFAGVDVAQEARRARQWLLDNPKHRKTKAGMRRFFGLWLAKSQDRSGASNGAYRVPSRKIINILEPFDDGKGRKDVTH